MPTVANGIDLDWAFAAPAARTWNSSCATPARPPALTGSQRRRPHPQLRQSRQHGRLPPAVKPSSTARTPTPEITAHRKFGAVKYGFGSTSSRSSPPTSASSAASAGTRASTSPSPTPRSIRPSTSAATTPAAPGTPQRQVRPHLRHQRHQTRPPALSRARRPRLPARRRQPQLRPRRHPRGLLQPPHLARPLLCARSPVHQPSRLQPGSRSGPGRISADACRLLSFTLHPVFVCKVFNRSNLGPDFLSRLHIGDGTLDRILFRGIPLVFDSPPSFLGCSGQLFERLHLPSAEARVHRQAALPVSRVRSHHPLVRQHSYLELDSPSRPLPRLQSQRSSWRYPLVELVMGLWFCQVSLHMFFSHRLQPSMRRPRITLTTNWWINFSIEQIGIAILGFLLIGLIVMDWQTHLLPDAFTLTGIAIGIFLVCTQAIFLAPHEDDIVLDHHTSAASSSPGSNASPWQHLPHRAPRPHLRSHRRHPRSSRLLLLLIRWLYQASATAKALGLGDVKLLAMIAAFLGFWLAILSLHRSAHRCCVRSSSCSIRGTCPCPHKLPLGSFISVGRPYRRTVRRTPDRHLPPHVSIDLKLQTAHSTSAA